MAWLINLVFWPIVIICLVFAFRMLGYMTDAIERAWCRSDPLPDLCRFSPETEQNVALLIATCAVVTIAMVMRQIRVAIKQWRQPGPRRTGRIIPLNYGYLWDDSTYPALITPEKFNSLCKIALTEEEFGKLATTEALSEDGNRAARAQREKYYTKIGQFLIRKRENGLDSVGYWLVHQWNSSDAEWKSDGLEIFTSYVDVLRYWRYPYCVEPAFDGDANVASLVFRDRAQRRPYTLQRDDILEIRGTPARFSMQASGATWKFDWRDGRMIINKKTTPASSAPAPSTPPQQANRGA